MALNIPKYLVVGAGFFGSIVAERIAEVLGEEVLVIDRRSHIGGNCHSEIDKETGIEFHKYGTHIFHTNNRKVWDYILRFTEFNGYRHQVLATCKDRVYQMPVNLETINAFYGINLKPFEVEGFLKKEIEKEKITQPRNLEEKAISQIGRPLYEAFIKGYTMKHWQKDPKNLPAAIVDRLPVRKSYNESYFFDMWQGIPMDGYDALFQKILKHRNIDVSLNTDFFDIRSKVPRDCVVFYSGPIDKYFEDRFGKLEWRSLDFVREVINVEDYQGTSVMNYTDIDIPWTRIHEPRHLHEERAYRKDKTLIFKEIPKGSHRGDPYYPVNDATNMKIFSKYQAVAKKERNVFFGGRLADYKYYDMHHTMARALEVFEEFNNRKKRQS